MTRGHALRLALIIVVVTAASVFGGLAHQAWSDSQAHGRMNLARAAAVAAMRTAVTDGVSSSDLAAVYSRLAALDHRSPPAATPIVGAQASHFYDAQARSYRRLRRETGVVLRRVTRRRRTAVTSTLAALERTIGAARNLGLHPTAARGEVTVVEQAVRSGPATPRRYAALLARIQPVAARLAAAVALRRSAVAAILRASGNSAAAVQKRASAELAPVMQQLSLMALVSNRAAPTAASLTQARAVVQRQRAGQAAAVADLGLEARLAAARAVLARDLPAKMIVVSTEKQWAWMYQDGNPVYNTPVTTGGPELPTDHGVFHIYLKVSPFVFHSPFPPSSPYYYNPTPISYWMPFDGQEGLHDAWWRPNFGPGSNYQPTDLGGGRTILGTHGCVNMPLAAARFVWDWAPVGTTVVVR